MNKEIKDCYERNDSLVCTIVKNEMNIELFTGKFANNSQHLILISCQKCGFISFLKIFVHDCMYIHKVIGDKIQS